MQSLYKITLIHASIATAGNFTVYNFSLIAYIQDLDLLSLRFASALEEVLHFFMAVAGEAGCFREAGACINCYEKNHD